MQGIDEPASLARVGPQVDHIAVAALVLGLPALGRGSVAAERQLFPAEQAGRLGEATGAFRGPPPADLLRPVDRDGRGRPARRRPPAPTLAG